MRDVFNRWDKGPLDSYLIEITSHILGFTDENGKATIDLILDTAGQKGTGKWTVTSALDTGQPLTLIGEAVFARCLSAIKDERDYFGAHTYERIDQPRGIFFHTNWTGRGGSTASSTYVV